MRCKKCGYESKKDWARCPQCNALVTDDISISKICRQENQFDGSPALLKLFFRILCLRSGNRTHEVKLYFFEPGQLSDEMVAATVVEINSFVDIFF